jgi:lipoprotein signal peptidase
VRQAAVTDFLDFHALHWPAFNLADAVIFCGVATLLLCIPTKSATDSNRKPATVPT